MKAFIFLLPFIALGACASIPMNASFRAADEVKLESGTLVVLETGESIDIAALIAAEGKAPASVVVHKAHGTYVLAANGFKNAYLLWPKSGDEASLSSVELKGAENGGATEVAIRPALAAACSVLSYKAGVVEKKLYITTSGGLEPECDVKAGESK